MSSHEPVRGATRLARSWKPSLVGLTAVAAIAGGCDPAVPDSPTWAEDVRPILLANCASCHSYPPERAAPAPRGLDDDGQLNGGFRLDVYGDFIFDEGTVFNEGTDNEFDASGKALPGAAAMSDRIVARAVDAETMPPAFPGGGPRPLSERQQEILQKWHDQGAERGPPLPGNQRPTMELLTPLENSLEGDTLTVEYEIDDPDFNYVTGALRARFTSIGASPPVITYGLHSGRGEATWDVSDYEGHFEIRASLDDGSVVEEIVLGTITIE